MIKGRVCNGFGFFLCFIVFCINILIILFLASKNIRMMIFDFCLFSCFQKKKIARNIRQIMKHLNNSNPILTTKLQRPSLPRDFIAKQVLLDYLDDNFDRPLTLVSAGSGFGKSTFVNYWLSTLPYNVAWLSLDEGDNDIRTVIAYLIEAIRTSFPKFGTKTETLLYAEQLPPINVFAHYMINDLSELPKKLFLAIDDFNMIIDLDILNFFSIILKYTPPNLHLILITRSDPPLQLTKLRALNKMKEIRSSHLRMSEVEIKEFVSYHIDVEDSIPIVSMLNKRLEGWITGMRLAMVHLSLQNENEKTIDIILTESNFTEEYFIKEILNHVSDKTLSFLLTTSILQKFNSQIAEYLLAISNKDCDSQKVIKTLVEKNLFIINLDSTGEWYRYHHLFQSLLQKELRKHFSEEMINELHKRASYWYESVYSLDDAFYHASRVIGHERTVELIENNMYTALNENKWYVLEQWLKKLPDNEINKNPELIIAKMWILHHKNEIWAIPNLMSHFQEINMETPIDKDVQLQKQFFQAVPLFWSTEIEKSIALLSNVRSKLSTDKLAAKSLADIYFASASQMNGTGKEVYKEIEHKLYSNKQSIYYQIMLRGALVYMKMIEGNLFAAEHNSQQVYKLGKSANDIFGMVWGQYFIGYVAFQKGDYDNAENCFSFVLDNIYIINMTGSVDSFAGMLFSQLALNKTKELEETLEQFIRFVEECNNPVFMTISYSVRARLELLRNNVEKATQLISMANMDFDAGTKLFQIEAPRITQCRVLLAQNTSESIQNAITKLQDQLYLAQKTRNIPNTINVQVLLAVAYLRQNKIVKAKAFLNNALKAASEKGFIRPFMELGDELNTLLALMDVTNQMNQFVFDLRKRIISKNNLKASQNRQTSKEYSEHSLINLSNRELDVIELLSKRFSNKEIASELHISAATVKRHTITIYQKLNVNKRRQAVEVAQSMGLINH